MVFWRLDKKQIVMGTEETALRYMSLMYFKYTWHPLAPNQLMIMAKWFCLMDDIKQAGH